MKNFAKLPNNITRCPRKIESERQYWKATEFRSFHFFYGPNVIHVIFLDEHYTLFIFLSEAIFTLLGERNTLHELDRAEKLLFCAMFSALPCIRRLSPQYHRQSKFWCPNKAIR